MVDKIIDIIKDVVIGLGKFILLGIVNNSYWICLFICLVSLILYIAGMKKMGKYISISFIAYFVLQAIKGAIL